MFAGAGSHAAYFEQGEYLTAAPIPAARAVRGVLDALRSFWRDALRQDDPGDLAERIAGALSIPFIDYARADGRSIGPGEDVPWDPILIDDDTPWVDGYRGLFGLDTYDRFAGERAPAGPKWGRSGVVRQTWSDPVGWAGLAKVATPSRAPSVLADRIASLEAELAEIRATDREKGKGCRVSSSRFGPSASASHTPDSTPLGPPTSPVAKESWSPPAVERPRSSTRSPLRGGSWSDSARATSGIPGHISAATTIRSHPSSPAYGRFVELWSAVSISLVLLIVVGSLVTGFLGPIASIILGLGVYIVIDAAFRRRLGVLVLRTTMLLAARGVGDPGRHVRDGRGDRPHCRAGRVHARRQRPRRQSGLTTGRCPARSSSPISCPGRSHPERAAEVTRVLAGAGWLVDEVPVGDGTGLEAIGAEAIRTGADAVVAIGGDGTAALLAHELAGTQVALAIVPAGTGNVIARNLGIPRSPTEAARSWWAADVARSISAGCRRRTTACERSPSPAASDSTPTSCAECRRLSSGDGVSPPIS